MFMLNAGTKQQLFRSKTNPEGRCRGSVPTAITSTLEPFPTRIVTSSLANLRLIRSPCFELQILATELVSNTQALLRALVRYTSITCISHIPLFTLPSFLSAKYLGQFPLLVTSPFAVEALSLRLS